MAIGLIAWGRFFKTDAHGNVSGITVPAPPTDPGKPWLADMLRSIAQPLAASFEVIQWPNFVKAQGGTHPEADGYGTVDLRDFGSKNAQGSLETRYGSLEAFMAAIAALEAHGAVSYGDLVFHQQTGENLGPGLFSFVGADGTTMDGRGKSVQSWYRGNTGDDNPVPPFSPQDDVPDRSSDPSFGRERCYQNCDPPRATTDDAIDAFQMQVKRTGAKGFRFDDAKGVYSPFVAELMNGSDLPFYSEYFDGNPANLNKWATSCPMEGRSAVEDFPLHFSLQAACNNYDATLLDSSGYWQLNSALSVGFVDNPDTDTTAGQQVVSNKGLAYAFMLNLPLKLALVYGKDYFPDSVWPGAHGLQPLIDNLCWISRTFAFGAFERRWVDRNVYVYTRDGNGGIAGWSGGLLIGLNFDTLSPHTVTVLTAFGANQSLHDYTGHAPDIVTDDFGNATITLPANTSSSGQSYVAYAHGGVDKPVALVPRRTTHTFIGDRTRDVMPVLNGDQTLPQRIHVAKGSEIVFTLRIDKTGWTSSTTVFATISGPDAQVIATERVLLHETVNSGGHAIETGFHTVLLTGYGLPTEGSDFEADVTYLGSV
jgi:alpha-amylase